MSAKAEDPNLPPNNKTKKPSVSNTQLQNEINLLREEVNWQENIIAGAYDQLDTMQNNIGVLKQRMKSLINGSPLKKPQVNKIQNMEKVPAATEPPQEQEQAKQ